MYTFGEPRIGNKPFVEEINSVKGLKIFRTILHNDPVPHMPPRVEIDPTQKIRDGTYHYYHPGV